MVILPQYVYLIYIFWLHACVWPPIHFYWRGFLNLLATTLFLLDSKMMTKKLGFVTIYDREASIIIA